ncbi:unnamed protein product [Gordionus sp. m RMFG-2023]
MFLTKFNNLFANKNILSKQLCSKQLDADKYGRQEDSSVKNRILIFKEQKNDDPRKNYFDAINVFIAQGKHGRGAVEFIYDILGKMKPCNVHKNLGAYKALLSVFPVKIMVPENTFQVEFFHYPKQQTCAITVLDFMEHHGVAPDEELFNILKDRFGEWTHVLRKFRRIMYWKNKFKNINPFLGITQPLEDLIPPSAYGKVDNLGRLTMTCSQLALYRMYQDVDMDLEIHTFYPSHNIPTYPNSSNLIESSEFDTEKDSDESNKPFIYDANNEGSYTKIMINHENGIMRADSRHHTSYLIKRDDNKCLKAKFKELKELDRNIKDPFVFRETLLESYDKYADLLDKSQWTFIVGQTPEQKALLNQLVQEFGEKDNKPSILTVEGPDVTWVQGRPIKYFTLKSNLTQKEMAKREGIDRLDSRDYDDVSDWPMYFEKPGIPVDSYPLTNVHEIMPDGAKIFATVIFRSDITPEDWNFFGGATKKTKNNLDVYENNLNNDNLVDIADEDHGNNDNYRYVKNRVGKEITQADIFHWLKCLEVYLDNKNLSQVPTVINFKSDPIDIRTFQSNKDFMDSKSRDHSRPINFEEVQHPVYKL